VTGFNALGPAMPLGRIGVGDTLQITLWEPNPAGTTLLTPPGLQTTLRVDPSGCIGLPYVGVLHVAGRTPLGVEGSIMAVLSGQGHSIQAAVLDAQEGTNAAIAAGDITRPGAYPLVAGAESLLDLIAMAGGPRQADDATLVQLRRGGVTAEAPLADVTANQALNVPLAPGDSVTLVPRDRVFYAFGAVNRPGLFPYDAQHLTLVRALAEISGLQDNLAAPRGVFIYRAAATGPQTIYRLDLSQPEGFFTAGRFILAPDDIIYVSDAPIANVSKVLQTISGVSGMAGIPRNFGAPY
jgi:polysaccharide export outer membrane protein